MPILDMKKQTQFKPNLSQNKPNSNPIPSKGKIDAKCVFTESYDDKTVLWLCENKPKTNPISPPPCLPPCLDYLVI